MAKKTKTLLQKIGIPTLGAIALTGAIITGCNSRTENTSILNTNTPTNIEQTQNKSNKHFVLTSDYDEKGKDMDATISYYPNPLTDNQINKLKENNEIVSIGTIDDGIIIDQQIWSKEYMFAQKEIEKINDTVLDTYQRTLPRPKESTEIQTSNLEKTLTQAPINVGVVNTSETETPMDIGVTVNTAATLEPTKNAYEIVKTPKTDTKWTPYAGIFTGFKYPIVADENLGAIPVFGVKGGARKDKLGIYGTLSIAETNETERTDTSYATLDSTSFDIGLGVDYNVFNKDKLNVRVGGGPRLSIENNRGRIDVNEASLDIDDTEIIFGGEVFGEANYSLKNNLDVYLNLGVGGNFSGDNSNTDVDGKVLFGLNYEF